MQATTTNEANHDYAAAVREYEEQVEAAARAFHDTGFRRWGLVSPWENLTDSGRERSRADARAILAAVGIAPPAKPRTRAEAVAEAWYRQCPVTIGEDQFAKLAKDVKALYVAAHRAGQEAMRAKAEADICCICASCEAAMRRRIATLPIEDPKEDA